jgi:hypothetical protein
VRRAKKKGVTFDARTVELASLTLMSILASLKIFQLSFQASRWLMLVAGVALVVVYARPLVKSIRTGKNLPAQYQAYRITYYIALILFIVSFAISDVLYRLSNTVMLLALVVGLASLAMALMNHRFLVNGTEETAWSWTLARKDRSALLMVLFIFMALYMVLAGSGILPPLYSDEFPPAFYTMQDTRDDGAKAGASIDHRAFKREYLHFVERNLK